MWRRWVADIHLWLSLIVGLQVLAWIVSGLFMSVQPIERVRSEHLMETPTQIDLRADVALVAPAALVESMDTPVRRVSLDRIAGKTVYLVELQNARPRLYDAASGALLSPIGEGLARTIAEQAIAGHAAPARAQLIEHDPPIEYRGELPVWRLDFDGPDKLSVFVAADTGRVAARRSDLWRAYDFLWSLHIMDYRDRENFNHPLLIVFSVGALVMSIFGIVLLFLRLPARIRSRRST